jgi:hypothetical protein
MAKLKSKTEVVTHEYVTREDKLLPKEEQTVFVVRDLTNAETLSIQDMAMRRVGEDIDLRPQHMMLEQLVLRLVDVRNLQNEKGKPVALPSSIAGKRALLDLLDMDTLIELISVCGSTPKGLNEQVLAKLESDDRSLSDLFDDVAAEEPAPVEPAVSSD